MQTQDDLLRGVYLGFDEQNVYLRVDLREGMRATDLLGRGFRLHVYATTPGEEGGAAFPEGSRASLGFPLQQRITLDLDQVRDGEGVPVRYAYRDGAWVLATSPADLRGRRAYVGEVVEMRLPHTTLRAEPGDTLRLAVVLEREGRVVDTAPDAHPLALSLPQRLAGKEVLAIPDPEGDEHGPGTYTYPKDNAFAPFQGLFDLLEMRILDSGATWTFVFSFKEMTNPWGPRRASATSSSTSTWTSRTGGAPTPSPRGPRWPLTPSTPGTSSSRRRAGPSMGSGWGFPTARTPPTGSRWGATRRTSR